MKIVFLIWSVLAMMASCHSSEDAAKLTEMKWTLELIDGKKVETQVENNVVFMQFNDKGENRVSGIAGCNRFFGGYEEDGNKLKFSHMGATRMTCPDIELEMKFFKVLENTDNFVIKDRQLSLRQKDKVLAVFKGTLQTDKK